MSSMSPNRQGGYISSTLISLIIASVLLVGALIFGGWAFASRQDYKNNSDKKAAAAAALSKEKTEADDAVKYAEAAKKPLKTHVGPSQFGSVNIVFPKTWSAYISETGKGSSPVDDYFHPDFVPDIDAQENAYALRVEVVDQAYDRVIEQFKNDIAQRKVAAAPYALPKVPTVVGTRFEGQVEKTKQGVMVVLPLRNMTLKIWTESSDFVADFNTNILPNFTFSP